MAIPLHPAEEGAATRDSTMPAKEMHTSAATFSFHATDSTKMSAFMKTPNFMETGGGRSVLKTSWQSSSTF